MTSTLIRLRRDNNRLERRLNTLEKEMSIATGRYESEVEMLAEELRAIKSSRTWRVANRIRGWLDRLRIRRVSDALSPRDLQYREYLVRTAIDPAAERDIQSRVQELPYKPLISIVMPVHDPNVVVLEQAVSSVLNQIYPHWELCIVDDASKRSDVLAFLNRLEDPRVKVYRNQRPLNIAGATNIGVSGSSGEYVGFMDHDDEMAPDALAQVGFVINEKGADFIYTDEDSIGENGMRCAPHFKPDFSPDLLLSHNYITHLVVVSRDLIQRTGAFRSRFDGAQDLDFVLRATEGANGIHHIPRILYHWRMSDSSTSKRPESKPMASKRGKEAIEAALTRRGILGFRVEEADVPHFYHVRYAVRDHPLVSIIVPFKDRADLLHCVMGDIIEKTEYSNYEIIGVSNDSVDPGTYTAMQDLAGLDCRIRFIELNEPFNFPALINHGVRNSSGEHIVSINNDIRVSCPGWLTAMLEHSQREGIGVVGGKLYYPDGRVQHAGVVVGVGGYAGHSHKGFPAEHQGYFNRLRVVQNVSAVTGAFMMVERKLFESVNGFDEKHFAVACNDVDFCLRVLELGVRNLFTPHAYAVHLESATRGYEDTKEKQERFSMERERFFERHARILDEGDPCYNPNLTREREDFSIHVPTSC